VWLRFQPEKAVEAVEAVEAVVKLDMLGCSESGKKRLPPPAEQCSHASLPFGF